ncbi:dihydrolipoyllysine-residue acetyltransferase [Neisseria sp. Ec49-e6-T10]|uniref:dihydrolipoyllysine-residue acetyltransferase n=1 Tax=Neisseria sp. Ec49-e6-T10 TaxID=3140744 RepID=UPI003EBD5AE4
MSQLIEQKVPDIGGHDNVDIIDVAVKVGDSVNVDDTLITLETDKATMDVPATQAGIVKEIKVTTGDKISEGGVILVLESAATQAATTQPVEETKTQPVATAAPTASSNGQDITLVVPDIGGHDNVDIIDVAVKVGDTINVDDTLITLETDKATMDVPATAAGVVKEVKVKVGDKISEGGAIVVVSSLATTSSVKTAPAQVEPTAPQATTVASQTAAPAPQQAPRQREAFGATPFNEQTFIKAHASPSVRALARELGVDLGQLKGTGRKGRIVADDIKNYVKAALQGNTASGAAAGTSLGGGLDLLPWPKVDFAKFGEVEVQPLSRIKKISGQNLSRNWVMIPHVTVNEDADMTDLEAFRKLMVKEWEKTGEKLSPLAFIIKASELALKAFPEFNSSLDGDNLVLKKYYNIGFAADTPNGLVVPVIKNVDQMGVREISGELTRLSGLAREGKLKPTDMQGACFTISSLGGIGGTGFTPIVNAPEVAILGVCKSQIKPVWNGKEFEPRLMCPLSLSFDHRVIDGAAGMRFTVYIAKLLSDIKRWVL